MRVHAAEENMSTKENHNVTICDSKSLENEEDPLLFGGEKTYESNGSRGCTGPTTFEGKVFDDYPNDSGGGTIDTSTKENLTGHSDSHHLGDGESPDLFLSETKDDGRLHSRPELEFGNVNESMIFKKKESRKSGSVHITISDVFDTDTVSQLYTNKNVLARESPNLTFCSKEANFLILKDIWVDEAMSSKDGNSNKSILPDGLAAPSLGNTESMSNSLCENKEVSDDELLAPSRQRLAAENTAADASQEESFVDRKLPVQEFGTRGFLRSFLDEGNKALPPPDHGFPESHDKSELVEEEKKEDDQSSNISCHSKVEIRSINDNSSDTSGGPNLSCKDTRNTVDSVESLDPTFNNRSKNEVLAVELHVMNHERKTSDNVLAFSAAGAIPHSGLVAYSGSLSLRSDGSATSGRSFAFPLLQSEWNTSPVRMAKADRRKQKGWRSGLLCWKF